MESSIIIGYESGDLSYQILTEMRHFRLSERYTHQRLMELQEV